MQTSAAIATAAVAQERNPVATLKVDWDADGTYSQAIDDVSTRVESLTITRQLATDLPDEVARSAGYSSAQLEAVLSGDPTTEADNAGSYFSPFNTASALYGKRRRWRTCQVQIGFDSTTLPVFTGKTTGLRVDSASRTATLDALDLAETMRGVVDLPVVVADDGQATGGAVSPPAIRPGLNAAWVIDYLARKCGYFASPPARSGCRFLVTFAGSAWPETGSLLQVGPIIPQGFTAGKFIAGTDAVQLALEGIPSSTLSTNDNSEMLIEGWIKTPSNASRGFAQVGWRNTLSAVGTARCKVSVSTDSSNQLRVNIRRTDLGTITTYNSGLTVPTGQWVYIGVHVYMTSANISIHWRVGSSSASSTVSTTSVTGQPGLDGVSLGRAEDSTTVLSGNDCNYEAWQVTQTSTTTAAPSWNDAFVGNSTIMPAANALTATVPTPTASAWEQVQAVAAAELATAGFDETGNFTFYPRTRWTTAPWTISQRTIAATDSLTAIATSEATDQLRNRVRIAATPLRLLAATWVWAASEITSVPASGTTTVIADMGDPVYALSTSVRYASSSGLSGQSQYRANRVRDGSGTAVSNLTFAISQVGQLATITITNPNAFVVYLVSSSGFTDPAGTPSLALWGQPITPVEAQQPDTTTSYTTVKTSSLVDVSDATSIAQHGEQLLELSGNPWLQDVTSLGTLASDLLARLKDPLPILDGLTVVGDPRLQLGDRVTVVEPNLGLNGDFFLTGIVSTFDASGYTQALTVRGIS